MELDLVEYYRKRAGEYERVYTKPERQGYLERMMVMVAEAFRDQVVVEVSCGTGYWTEQYAPFARAVLACDLNLEMLEIACAKSWNGASVEFVRADSFNLPSFDRSFSAAFSGFWWSHIPRRRLDQFLEGLHAKLERGARVMFIDNRYVEGSSTPLSRINHEGDTFQLRRLEDGSTYEIMKNFPSQSDLLDAVKDRSVESEVVLTDYYWALSYQLL